MEIEVLLRKLRPLMPQAADRWHLALLTGPAKLKTLIEQQVIATARRILGDVRDKPLLSLPPKKLATGSFHLGTVVYEKPKWPFGLSERELLQNLAIFGRSGAGKTNIAFGLLEQLVTKKIGFLFLDWKRTARHLLPLVGKRITVYTPGRSLAPFPFNPFLVPPGVERRAYVNQVVDLMADAYTLGDGATSVLHKAIHDCYERGESAPGLTEILEAIDRQPTNQRSTGWKISARRACESLELSDVAMNDAKSQQKFAESLLASHTVLELDGVSQNTKKFLVPLLCYWVYAVHLAGNTRERLKFVIFLEEAHHTVYRHEHRAKETLMNVLLRQCRELGISFVLIDQHPHLVASAGLGNCYATICLNQKDPSDINKAAGLSGLEEGEKWFLSRLPVGQGIVKLQDRWKQPFVVEFPLVEISKGVVTDELLRSLQSGRLSLSELRERVGLDSRSKSRSRTGAVRWDNRAFALLHDIACYPEDGVDVRYKRLGVSIERGNRWKNQLVSENLVRADRVKVGRSYRVRLRLTSEARLLLTPREGRDPQASFVHEYFKRRVARRYESLGYKVALEAPRNRGGGSIDVWATKGAERVAIEVETGKSRVVANARRDLLCGATTVVVVATDAAALDKVERHLARAGLLIPQRVRVVLQDQGLEL